MTPYDIPKVALIDGKGQAYTGELLCVRLGKWVERCPNFPDGYTRE